MVVSPAVGTPQALAAVHHPGRQVRLERSPAITGMETLQLSRSALPFLWCGLFAACSAIIGSAQSISTDEIVRGADQRIERYRKGNAVLALTDSKGKHLEPGSQVRIQQVR